MTAPTKVYIVQRNADFTEGRGPMLFHSVWSNAEEAVAWVRQQRGIFGSPQCVTLGRHGKYATANGYDIIESEVIASVADLNRVTAEAERKAALAKLTERERKLLGL